jgi:peroxiredoxin
MKLGDQLAEIKAEFLRDNSEERATLYQAKIDELRANFVLETAIGQNDEAPDFELPDVKGKTLRLSRLLQAGPVVLTFYRGGWCPYCNLQLRSYQSALPEMEALGARLVAISPQLPDASLSTAEKNELRFDVLSDVGNDVARSYGLVFTLADELRDVMKSKGKALTDINGDDNWELPVPATYVIGRNGKVALAYVDVDYRNRLETEEIVASLKRLQVSDPGV